MSASRRRRRRDSGAINALAFDRPDVVATYTDAGWTDLGERRAAAHLTPTFRRARLLDIGVGTGRTTGLLTKRISTDYVGIDFAPNMVLACRRAYPDRDIRLGDARRLAEFGSATKDLIVFSNNGLDAVGDADRALALAEMARVLAPGGRLWFSTLNLDSWYASSRPWLINEAGLPLKPRLASVLPWLGRLPHNLPRYLRTYRNWYRHRVDLTDGPDWSVRHLQAHEFGLVAHFITLAGVHRELAGAGLRAERIFASSGDEIELSAEHSSEPYFHVIARAVE